MATEARSRRGTALIMELWLRRSGARTINYVDHIFSTVWVALSQCQSVISVMRLCNEIRMKEEQSRCCLLMLTID